MEIDLSGRIAVIVGPRGDLYSAIGALLQANGAMLSTVASEADITHLAGLDVLVSIAADTVEPAQIESLCRAAGERMATSGGRILNIVSVSGVIPVRGESRASTTSAAIVSLTKELALDLGERNVLVHVLAVG